MKRKNGGNSSESSWEPVRSHSDAACELGQGRKRNPNPNLLVRMSSGWGGGLSGEGVGAKKFDMSFEARGNQTFWRDIPGFWPPGGAPCTKSLRTKSLCCDPSDHLQESRGPPGPKSQKNLKKRKYPKKSKNTRNWTFWGIFFDFLGYFRGLFCRPPKGLFLRLFCGFGPGGPRDSCKWSLGSQSLCSTLVPCLEVTSDAVHELQIDCRERQTMEKLGTVSTAGSSTCNAKHVLPDRC